MSVKYDGFVVTWDDGMGVCVLMGRDTNCEGALEGVVTAPALVFNTKSQALKAIRISKLANALRKEQGRSYLEDFVESTKCLRVVPLVRAQQAKGE